MNAYTLAETIAEITKAQLLGDTVCGQIGDMRYNSSDALAPQDVNRMAIKIMDLLTQIEIQFKNLENKARKFHEEAPINGVGVKIGPREREEMIQYRGNMWDSLYNLVDFSETKIDPKKG
jgi:hypothetical protein